MERRITNILKGASLVLASITLASCSLGDLLGGGASKYNQEMADDINNNKEKYSTISDVTKVYGKYSAKYPGGYNSDGNGKVIYLFSKSIHGQDNLANDLQAGITELVEVYCYNWTMVDEASYKAYRGDMRDWMMYTMF